MTVKTKTVDIEVKADVAGRWRDSSPGTRPVFGNKDSYGEVVLPGAFAESLKTLRAERVRDPSLLAAPDGRPVHAHRQTIEAKEDERGLFVHVQLDTSINNGAQTYKLLKAGWSSRCRSRTTSSRGPSSSPRTTATTTSSGSSPSTRCPSCRWGANQETEILAVKSAALAVAAGVKAGQIVPTEAREDIEGAITALKGALATTPDQEKAAGTPDAKDEEPPAAKSEEQTTVPNARALAEATIQSLL